MHAIAISSRTLSSRFPAMHAKRLMALLATVEAAISGYRLALSDLGRGIRSRAAVKRNIKRMAYVFRDSACFSPKIKDAFPRKAR